MASKIIKARETRPKHNNVFPDWAEAYPGMELHEHARPTPTEVLEATASVAGRQPPAVLAKPNPLTTLNLRIRESTLAAVVANAKARGLTMKQVVCHALLEAGLQVAVADMEDRTPRRKNPISR